MHLAGAIGRCAKKSLLSPGEEAVGDIKIPLPGPQGAANLGGTSLTEAAASLETSQQPRGALDAYLKEYEQLKNEIGQRFESQRW
jgi:hypothetical protein